MGRNHIAARQVVGDTMADRKKLSVDELKKALSSFGQADRADAPTPAAERKGDGKETARNKVSYEELQSVMDKLPRRSFGSGKTGWMEDRSVYVEPDRRLFDRDRANTDRRICYSCSLWIVPGVCAATHQKDRNGIWTIGGRAYTDWCDKHSFIKNTGIPDAESKPELVSMGKSGVRTVRRK